MHWAVNHSWLPPNVYSTYFLPVVLMIRETPARDVYRDYMFYWSSFDRRDKEYYDSFWMTAEEEATLATEKAEAAAVDAELSASINRTHWTPPEGAEPTP